MHLAFKFVSDHSDVPLVFIGVDATSRWNFRPVFLLIEISTSSNVSSFIISTSLGMPTHPGPAKAINRNGNVINLLRFA